MSRIWVWNLAFRRRRPCRRRVTHLPATARRSECASRRRSVRSSAGRTRDRRPDSDRRDRSPAGVWPGPVLAGDRIAWPATWRGTRPSCVRSRSTSRAFSAGCRAASRTGWPRQTRPAGRKPPGSARPAQPTHRDPGWRRTAAWRPFRATRLRGFCPSRSYLLDLFQAVDQRLDHLVGRSFEGLQELGLGLLHFHKQSAGFQAVAHFLAEQGPAGEFVTFLRILAGGKRPQSPLEVEFANQIQRVATAKTDFPIAGLDTFFQRRQRRPRPARPTGRWPVCGPRTARSAQLPHQFGRDWPACRPSAAGVWHWPRQPSGQPTRHTPQPSASRSSFASDPCAFLQQRISTKSCCILGDVRAGRPGNGGDSGWASGRRGSARPNEPVRQTARATCGSWRPPVVSRAPAPVRIAPVQGFAAACSLTC